MLRHLRPAAIITRRLNSRYAGLPPSFFAGPTYVLDAGAGPSDALKAKRLFAACSYEGVNIAELPPSSAEGRAYDRYHLVDLDKSDLSFLPDRSYDLVVSSHTIEHLQQGLTVVGQLCEKIRPGGFLYLEWPSVESTRFPIRGFGLRFDDDATHRQTYSLAEVRALVERHGLRVQFARRRRQWLRMLLSPLLVIYHTLRLRRPVLYDLWDVTGFCYSLRAQRPVDS